MPPKAKTKAEKANPKVRGPSAPTDDKAPAAEVFPDPPAPVEPPAPSRTPSMIKKEEEEKQPAEEENKKLPDMSRCDSAIASLDRMVSRLKERYVACRRSVEEDTKEMSWIDSELARFERKLADLDSQLAEETAAKTDTETALDQGEDQATQLKNAQAELLASVQVKMRQLKLNSYRDTPKAIAYRSPHGILPPEIRPGNTTKKSRPDPFTHGRKPAPGTKSIYRVQGGLD